MLMYFQAHPGGHGLLLGMSYCTGRATLARLAAYIAHCKVRMIKQALMYCMLDSFYLVMFIIRDNRWRRFCIEYEFDEPDTRPCHQVAAYTPWYSDQDLNLVDCSPQHHISTVKKYAMSIS